jgi:hypothetical protein
MKTFKFAALAAGLLLQSLAHPANAPSHHSVAGQVGSVAVKGDRPAVARAQESRNYFLLPDINDARREACDPEDDCPGRN